MIVLNNISKSYYKDKELKILNNINYKFYEGKLYCIMGKSGAGKTTLIQLLGLLLKQDNGNILINGKDTISLNDNDISLIRNKEIGFIFQSFYLNPLMKTYENVMLPCYLDKEKKLKDLKNQSYILLNKLGLSGRENHYPKELSGGEKQRVAIARALINNPNIILADEPTGSLDEENEIIILDLLKKLAKQGKCIIIVTHSNNVAKYADKLLYLKNGKLEEVNIVSEKS